MEEITIKFYWLIIAAFSSLIVGVLSFIIKNAISKNATKESVDAKTHLLEKDIEYLKKGHDRIEERQNTLSKRITAVHENNKDLYVSKELFHETIKQFQEKLDAILKFVKMNNTKE